MDPNIIILRICSLGLSGVGVWPCRRKRRGSRKGKGDLKYALLATVDLPNQILMSKGDLPCHGLGLSY